MSTLGKRKGGRGGYRGGYKKRSRNNGVSASKMMEAALKAQETKYFDVGIDDTVTTAGSTWADTEVAADNYINDSGNAAAYTGNALIPSAHGDGYGQVVGNKYHLLGCRIRGTLTVDTLNDQANVTAAYQCRLLLVEDTLPNGSQAQGENVIQAMGGVRATLNGFLRAGDHLGKYRILKDKKYVFRPTAAGTDGANTNSVGLGAAPFKMSYFYKKPVEVNLKATSAATPTVSNLVNRNIFLLVSCVTGTGGAAPINISASSRAYFKG